MTLFSNLKDYDIVLGSGSPRRKELFSSLGLDFRIVTSDKEESYPPDLQLTKVPVFLSEMKAKDISKRLIKNFLLITADTVVILKDRILGKPRDENDAHQTLRELAGTTHSVVTGITLMTAEKMYSFTDDTLVSIAPMSDVEIEYSLSNDDVMDKAGSYGIQDWLGLAKVTSIVGSYYNVVGLPTEKLYKVLKDWH